MWNFIDLFCGVGGSGLGCRRAGLRPILAVDLHPIAVDVYRTAVGDKETRYVNGDVTELKELPEADLLWASPPCKPWSPGRRSQGIPSGFDHPDGRLITYVADLAVRSHPRWVVIENVDALPKEAIRKVSKILTEGGYSVTVAELDAAPFVPQNRKHTFIIGGPRAVLFRRLPPGPSFRSIIDGKEARPVSAKELRYALNKRAFHVPIITPEDRLPTVTTRPYHERWTCFVVPEPGVIRFPSFREAARAQGFPDDHPIHALHASKPSLAWLFLGNAVPVPLARFVVESIFDQE